MRHFLFKWYKNNRYGNTVPRNTLINTKNTGDIGRDCSAACDVFCSTVGNLQYNTIIEILELDDDNNQVGEPIRPTGDAVVPQGKR